MRWDRSQPRWGHTNSVARSAEGLEKYHLLYEARQYHILTETLLTTQFWRVEFSTQVVRREAARQGQSQAPRCLKTSCSAAHFPAGSSSPNFIAVNDSHHCRRDAVYDS